MKKFICILLWLLFIVSLSTYGYLVDKEAGYYIREVSVIAREYTHENISQLPENPTIPDLTGYETYDPTNSLILGGISGTVLGGIMLANLKEVKKLGKKVAVLEAKMDINTEDIKEVKNDK